MFYCSTHGGKCKASGVLRPHSFLSLFGERKEPCRAAKKRKRRPGKPFGWFPRTPSIDQSLALDLRRMEVLAFTVFVGREMTAIIKIACGAASEEASCIPLPPGRRKLHIRWLLLPFQTVTAALGHSLGRTDRAVRLYRMLRIRKTLPDRHHQDSVRRVVASGEVTWGGQIKPGKRAVT